MCLWDQERYLVKWAVRLMETGIAVATHPWTFADIMGVVSQLTVWVVVETRHGPPRARRRAGRGRAEQVYEYYAPHYIHI